ncbi:MAG: hypothetical protein LBP59_12090 [Planctomycetaceae bacterium]|nr:hypothetical protein [Planctomycetaceae bacterium]
MLSLAGQIFIVTKIVPLPPIPCSLPPKIYRLNFRERLRFFFIPSSEFFTNFNKKC